MDAIDPCVCARACGLWRLIDCSSVGSVVLAAEVSFACTRQKVRFGFGEPLSSVGRWCLRCAGEVGLKGCKSGLHGSRVLCWECVGVAWPLNISLTPPSLGRAHSSNRLVEVRRGRGGCCLEASHSSLLDCCRLCRGLKAGWETRQTQVFVQTFELVRC